jgi:hypothetical protein
MPTIFIDDNSREYAMLERPGRMGWAQLLLSWQESGDRAQGAARPGRQGRPLSRSAGDHGTEQVAIVLGDPGDEECQRRGNPTVR